MTRFLTSLLSFDPELGVVIGKPIRAIQALGSSRESSGIRGGTEI